MREPTWRCSSSSSPRSTGRIPDAAARLLRAVRVRHAVVSFPARSLGGRGKGMERTYRERLDRLVVDAGRVEAVAEASVPNELVFVLTLHG